MGKPCCWDDAAGLAQTKDGGVKLRVGVLLWLLSWVPFAVIFGLEGAARTVAWIVEITIGVVGLALAGTEVAGTVRASGWRKAPGIAWHALIHGPPPEGAH
jgi:hypothetical protein